MRHRRTEPGTAYSAGLVGRGVLLDIPRLRGVRWLEPGEAVTAGELTPAEEAAGVRLGRERHPGLPDRSSSPPRGARAVEQRRPAGRRGQGGPAREQRAADALAPGRRVPAGRRRRGGARLGRGNAQPRPCPADRRDGHAHLRQPAARGTGCGLRGGRPLGVHGRRASAAAAGPAHRGIRSRSSERPHRTLTDRP